MPEQDWYHLANKYEDIVNLHGAEAYRGGRPPTACGYLKQRYEVCYFSVECYIRAMSLQSIFLPPLRVGLGVVRIDPLRFMSGCRKRRLNQALSVLSFILGVSVVPLTMATFVLCYFVRSVSWLFCLGCQYQRR